MRLNIDSLKKPMSILHKDVYSVVKKSPVDSYLLTRVVCDTNGLHLSSCNGMLDMNVNINVNCAEQFSFVVNTDDLMRVVNIFNDVADINIKANVIEFKKGRRKVRINRVLDEEYHIKDYTEFKEKSIVHINIGEQISIAKKFVSDDKYRNALQGIFLINKETTNVAAANGHVLYIYRSAVTMPLPDEGLLLEYLERNDAFDLKQLYFENELRYNVYYFDYGEFNIVLYVRSISTPDQFPNVFKLTDNLGTDKYIKLNKEELLGFMSDARKMFGSSISYFIISSNDKIISFDYSDYTSVSSFHYETEDFEIGGMENVKVGFNINYLKLLIDNIDDDYIKLYTDGNSYYTLDDDMTQLIMPIRLDVFDN